METYKDKAYKLWCSNNIKTILPEPNEVKKDEYNKVPLYWCKHCLSLKILNCTENIASIESYCGQCGNTELTVGSIEEWEKLSKERFNNKIEEN